MKVTVTHLKAPWPQGCAPGDVVELAADHIPAWAVGKCVPAADDAPATHSLVPQLVVNPEQPASTGEAAGDIEAQAAQEKASIEAKAKGRTAKG